MPVVVQGLSFSYSKGTPFEKKALDNVSLTINDGEFVGIMGHTGSTSTGLSGCRKEAWKWTAYALRTQNVPSPITRS